MVGIRYVWSYSKLGLGLKVLFTGKFVYLGLGFVYLGVGFSFRMCWLGEIFIYRSSLFSVTFFILDERVSFFLECSRVEVRWFGFLFCLVLWGFCVVFLSYMEG